MRVIGKNMPSMDELGLNEVMSLFQEKKQAERQGDLLKLIALKKDYPQLFSKEFESMAYSLLDDMTMLMESRHFKMLRKEEEKRKFFVVDHGSWKTGRLDQALNKLEVIYYNYIKDISRDLVKEAVAASLKICLNNHIDAEIEAVCPLLGTLISQLLTSFPAEKREKMQERALFKLNLGIPSTLGWDSHVGDTLSLPATVVEAIQCHFHDLVRKTVKKFDKRDGFYTDCLFFCLLEVCEFVGQLTSHMATSKDTTKKALIKHITTVA